MSVLICKNIETEGPGTIGTYLTAKGIPFRVVELSSGENPAPGDDYDTLVLLGGPMSANEEERYPYLAGEGEMVREFMTKGRKVLGICLGAQIIAKALGAKVYKNPHKETGWHPIMLTEDGRRDDKMLSLVRPEPAGVEASFPAFHWHEETYDLPKGAVHLAYSALCANQVFRYGENVYGFQCHMEVTEEMIYDWMMGERVDQVALREETRGLYKRYHLGAQRFYDSFFAK